MKLKQKIFMTVVFLVCLSLITYFTFRKSEVPIESVRTDYTKLELNGNEKLMIVAHPDDEMLWGAEKLLKDEYVVVCITCGGVKKRVDEFEKVMKETEDKYIMLNYPDKVGNKRSQWEDEYDDITKDIKNIYNLQNWSEVVTYNPEGQYGHEHHKMTSNIVTDVVPHDKLIYYGKYFSKNKAQEMKEDEFPPRMDEDLLKRKEEILKIYESQDFIFDMFAQMFPYEDYKTYDEWQAMTNEEN